MEWKEGNNGRSGMVDWDGMDNGYLEWTEWKNGMETEEPDAYNP